MSVPRNGIYSFYTASDDGSRLHIGDVEVVDNDGLHSMCERSGKVARKAGFCYHRRGTVGYPDKKDAVSWLDGALE